MAQLSADSLVLAGFALAHAVWSVSDTAAGELLCPLAVVEEGAQRRLLRFAAETQEEAIESGKAAADELRSGGSPFAFAREGQWRPEGPDSPPEDVLTVEFWAPGLGSSQALLQPFRRAMNGLGFTLLSEPQLVLEGNVIPPEDAQAAIDIVLAGIESHPAVAPLWATWKDQ